MALFGNFFAASAAASAVIMRMAFMFMVMAATAAVIMRVAFVFMVMTATAAVIMRMAFMFMVMAATAAMFMGVAFVDMVMPAGAVVLVGVTFVIMVMSAAAAVFVRMAFVIVVMPAAVGFFVFLVVGMLFAVTDGFLLLMAVAASAMMYMLFIVLFHGMSPYLEWKLRFLSGIILWCYFSILQMHRKWSMRNTLIFQVGRGR